MATECPMCGRPYGKRKRCYFCAGRAKTGATVQCVQCGKEFYQQANQLRRGEGVYCSRSCKAQAQKLMDVPWAKRDEKTMHSAGYVLIWDPSHPRSSHGRVLEHIVVAEQMLGRPLGKDEFVHHKDKDKTNNLPDNLQILSNAEHSKLHAETNPVTQFRRFEIVCQECGKAFGVPANKLNSSDPRSKAKYCSLDCRHAAWAKQMVIKRREKRDLKE